MKTLLLVLTAAAAALAAEPNDYSKPESWLCRPGRADDACGAADLSTTVVAANGSLTAEKWTGSPNAPIDCFYVYPTVSLDPTPNSDMRPGPEERNVIKHQFARFGTVCKLYAPMYRQVTLTALRAGIAGRPMQVDRVLVYKDVLDAWNYYLEHDNQGRGVVLIGHSQGSGVLTQLIKSEIDGKPVQAKMISALLMGANVPVPKGKDVGGAFQKIPLCKSPMQTGCAVAYASFRANEPPPANSLFGRVPGEGMVAACVNPAALGGGSGALHAYLGAGPTITSTAAPPPAWVTPAPSKPIDTAFVSVPGLLSAECVADEHGSYLAIKVNADPKDPRTDDISGDVITNGAKQPQWGLHLIDANLTMGNLVDLVAAQRKAYLARPAASSR